MSIGDVAALIGGIVAILAFLSSLFACTWHLSAKIQQVISDNAMSRAMLDAHVTDFRIWKLEIEARVKALEHGKVASGLETV